MPDMKYTKLVEMTRVEDSDKIRCCDMHSLDAGRNLNPIIHIETVGQTPADFSPDRSFWRILSMSEHA